MTSKSNIIGVLLFITLALFTVFVSAEDVPHQKLDMECETCHTTDSFDRIEFDHSKIAGYDLEGRHQTADCKGCHDLKDFSSVKENCTSCHQDVHSNKLGQDCIRCHSSDGWSKFDFQSIHTFTETPLMGRHAMVDCQSCHPTLPYGDLTLNRTRCVDCHQSDFLNTGSPNHVSDGFSTECQDCHQMVDWRPALLASHDAYFPIYSGEHEGEWSECATCHTDPATSQVFSCLNCHEHEQFSMDSKHGGIVGYVYSSPDCYLCHPDGKATNFAEHDNLYFPIFNGLHASEWETCATCHTNPVDRKTVDCLSCHVHNQIDTDSKHGSMTGYSYQSSACYSCHPDGTKGQFTAHDGEFFPIFSGTHASKWTDCAECHTVPDDRTQFDCLTCHPGSAIDPVHLGMQGYLYESVTCYGCHPTGDAGEFVAHDATYFPIYSGTHGSTWTDCAECHTVANDKTVYNCLSCHPANESDLLHGRMVGYSAISNSCYDCHPSGLKGTFTAHDIEFMEIFAGDHSGKWSQCETCHTVPKDRTSFFCFECHDHNQTDMDDKHLGKVQDYVYESNTCFDCHFR